jgi:motility quorum-sensing regulator/GCU-specific mRNA interferase toxin
MEKHTPHCPLARVKSLVLEQRAHFTRTALEGAARLGFDADGVLTVLNGLTMKDFYKSMTTHANHRIWQDVYRPTTIAGEVYLKLTVVDDLLIVSFKEL